MCYGSNLQGVAFRIRDFSSSFSPARSLTPAVGYGDQNCHIAKIVIVSTNRIAGSGRGRAILSALDCSSNLFSVGPPLRIYQGRRTYRYRTSRPPLLTGSCITITILQRARDTRDVLPATSYPHATSSSVTVLSACADSYSRRGIDTGSRLAMDRGLRPFATTSRQIMAGIGLHGH